MKGRYTITLFKFPLTDTNEVIIYWELEYADGCYRFSNYGAAKEWADKNIN